MTMNIIRNNNGLLTTLLFALRIISSAVFVQGEVTFPNDSPAVGDQICTYGYIMDEFCINRGTLLDNSRVKTLENPEKHSVHCLVDVGVCVGSPFHVLQPNPPDADTPYGAGWAVSNNDLLVTDAQEVGSCSTCSSSRGKLQEGYQAEVIGNVVTVDPPLLEVVAVRDLKDGEAGCTQPMDPNSTIAPAPAPAPGSSSSSGGGGSSPTLLTTMMAATAGAFVLAVC